MIENDCQSAGNPERGYWLNFSPDELEFTHEFCGEHDIPGAVCPNCEKPLLRLLSLNAEDPSPNLDREKTPFVHLFFCWTCALPYDDFTYRVTKDGGIELLEVLSGFEGAFGKDGPYDRYTGAFPMKKVSLRPQSNAESERLARRWTDEYENADWDELWESRHQVGGCPFIANPEKKNCPVCKTEMPVLANICDSAVDNNSWQTEHHQSFAGNCGVQMVFLFCRDCSVVSGYHCCD